MNTLKAEKRTMDIKAKRLRREGFVTGNVFGRQIETSIPIKMDKQAVERLLKTCGKGSRITLDISIHYRKFDSIADLFPILSVEDRKIRQGINNAPGGANEKGGS